MKKILISGYYGFDNFGDEIILQSLIKHLKGQDVTVLSANPKKTSRLYNVKALFSFDVKNLINSLNNYDILISGGGSLIQNVTSLNSLLYYTSLISMMKSLKKDVIIFAQGIGPINGFWGNFITKRALKGCKCISVRDEKSLALLKSWNIDANLVCDPAFSIELDPAIKTRKIGIQLRKDDNLTDELFDSIISNIASRYSDRKIELLCLQDQEDEGISKVFKYKFNKKFPTVDVSIIKGLTTKQILNKISEYDYLIAMRYHACLLGLRYGIKTMAICYDPKVEILAKESGIPYLNMDSSKNNYKEQFDKLNKFVAFNLVKYAAGKEFDWSKTGIDDLINEQNK